jgi:hypothetical protein
VSALEVKRLDSPLARGRTRAAHGNAAEPKTESPDRQATTHQRERPAAPEKLPLASLAGPADRSARAAEGADVVRPQPPALDEPLELISSRLPMSLRRSLAEFTAVLRMRGGERTSQKKLPEQEVLAVLVWLAGSPDDPAAVQRLGAAIDDFRRRRYAAAAEILTAPAFER